jgi:hypothetical protein
MHVRHTPPPTPAPTAAALPEARTGTVTHPAA